jgi:hypothetical protein
MNNINFYMKLRKNASQTCATLSKAYGGEAMKKSNVFEWHKWFKESSHVEFIPQGQIVNQAYYVEILKWLHEAVHIKGLNFGLTIEFCTMTMLQLSRYSLSSSFWPKNQLLKWNSHPVPLISLSE